MLEATYLLSDEFITLNQAETYAPKEATKKKKTIQKVGRYTDIPNYHS